MSIPADGPEQVITADEYLHPQSAAARHQRGLTAPGGKVPYHINGALELVSSLCCLHVCLTDCLCCQIGFYHFYVAHSKQ